RVLFRSPGQVGPFQVGVPRVLLGLGSQLGGGVQVVGQAIAQLGAELGQLVAAPGIGGLAIDAVIAAICFATQISDADSAEGIQAVVALIQCEGWGDGQASGCQTNDS